MFSMCHAQAERCDFGGHSTGHIGPSTVCLRVYLFVSVISIMTI